MASLDEILELARGAARRQAAKAAIERGGLPGYQEASADPQFLDPNGLAHGMLSTATSDPFERAALRGRETVRPSGGRADRFPQTVSELQAARQRGWEMAQEAGTSLVPRTPADFALTAASMPVGGPFTRTALTAAGLVLDPSEAQAGAASLVRKGAGKAAQAGSRIIGNMLGRASPEEITRAAAESPGMTGPQLRELYDELGLTGRPPSEAVRPSLEAQHPAEEIERATRLKFADREMMNRLTPEERKTYQKTGRLPGGAMLPSQEAAEPARQAFAPVKKEVTRAEEAYDEAAAAGRAPKPIFDLSAGALSRQPEVEQFPLPRLAPKITERLQPAFQGGAGLRRIERAAGAAGPRDWAWYNIQEPLSTFPAVHGPVRGPEFGNAWLDSLAGTSMVNPIDPNARASSHYLGRIIRGEPLPEVLSLTDPQTGKTIQTLAGGPAPGYGAKSQVQHAARVREFLGNEVDPVANPKPISYRQDLGGNWIPRTVDTHDVRNMLGMPHALTAFGAEEGTLLPGEYSALEQLGGRAAERAGRPQAMQQGATWIGGAPYTGLRSTPLPLADVLNRRAQVTGMVRGVSPMEAWLDHVSGRRALLGLGGGSLAAPMLEAAEPPPATQ